MAGVRTSAGGEESAPAPVDFIIEATIEQDADGCIAGWDAGAERLLGWRAVDALGRKSHILIPERNRSRHEKARAEMLSGPTSALYRRMITVVHRDGREFPVHVSIGAIEATTGRRLVAQLREVPAVGEAPQLDGRALSILDQIEDGCSVLDLRGTYLYANTTFCRMVGRPKDEIIGSRYSAVMSAERAKLVAEIYSDVYRTGTPNRGFEFQGKDADGSIAFFEQSVSLQRDAAGRPIGFLAVARNCTTRRFAEQQTTRAREAAEAASRAKSEFLANMSHEIRTPMNGIIGMTDLALDTDLTDYQLECLNAVKASAESLLTILNDILDFSKIESRKLELEAVPFSLTDVITSTLRPLSIQADQKQLELILDIAAGVPTGLIGDPVRLNQILTNLVGNALKFTDHGHIVIAVRMEAGNDHDVVLRFSVTDTGIGIPKDKHRTIFDAFRQADGSTTRRFGGTGLGLTIVSTLVELMGGYIRVESEPGQGSTFRFTAVFGLSPTSVEPDRLPELEGVRVLIVDDNAVNRRIFEGQASSWGMLPHVVDSGRAALDALQAAAAHGEPFSLVLLDANMPDLDGFDVAQRIAESELAGAAIMLLTSSGQYGDQTRCRDLGIASYLTKPVKQADLRAAVSRALKGVQSISGERSSKHSGPHVETRREAETPRGTLRPVQVLLVEDNIVNQRVAVGILKKRGHVVTVANNGQEALDLLARQPYELVLMDLQMPVMGGFEATAAIRERERRGAGRVRIVAMTAHAMQGDRERCLAAGMDGYVTKPIDPKVLCAAVEEERSAPTNAPVDRVAALQLMGGDEQLLMDVIRLFLADCPARLAAIKTAIDRRDAEQIRREAHGLKGASGNLAATALVDAAKRLEKVASDSRLEGIDAAWLGLSNAAQAVLESLRVASGFSRTS